MPFLTPEQILGIRKKGSKLISLEALDGKQIRVIKMSSTAQLESEALQVLVRNAGATQSDFLRFMLKSACADVEGNLLTEQDARDLFDALPLSEVSILIQEITSLIDGAVVKLKLKQGTEDSKAPEVEVTPAEKKDVAS